MDLEGWTIKGFWQIRENMLNKNSSTGLYWLPIYTDIEKKLDKIYKEDPVNLQNCSDLLNSQLNFLQLNRLGVILDRCFRRGNEFSWNGLRETKVAILSSATIEHLIPAIKISLLRRGLIAEIYTHDFGQYLQEVNNRESSLFKFDPNVVIIALDSENVIKNCRISSADPDQALNEAKLFFNNLWGRIKDGCKGQIIQQSIIPTQISLMGSAESYLIDSSAALIGNINYNLKNWASQSKVDMLSLDEHIQRVGFSTWHDRSLWHYSKQDISPQISPLYGDLVSRVIAARAGLTKKCLVLDLDNTLWGGVIGDDGIGGIRIGNGDPVGEAFLAFQKFVLELSKTGIILAVCSKNDLNKALEPFDSHPDMILKQNNFACFIANWDDKASNLRKIAAKLNIGLDSMVFVDDNPFERDLVRKELPMVFVPELPNDPSYYAQCISDSGCFERVNLTEDDRLRAKQYIDNIARSELETAYENIVDYLVSLDMRLKWGYFSEENLIRCTQLINKTNQFNITGSRYLDDEIQKLMADSKYKCIHFRLVDKFGDNGIISTVIIKEINKELICIDTWVMSCRVFGRNVEHAIFQVLIEVCKKNCIKKIIGNYIETGKNSYVAHLFEGLGFINLPKQNPGITSSWIYDLSQKNDTCDYFRIEAI